MRGAKKSSHTGRIAAIITGALAAIIIMILLIGFIGSRIVRLRRVSVSLDDLPEAFDGTKILFVSDIDIVGFTSVSGVARLFDRLERLEPDILLLGGDYACDSLFETLNSTDTESGRSEIRSALFKRLNDFDAPLGKFAVAGDTEENSPTLFDEMKLGGITLLSDVGVTVSRGDSTIGIVGLSPDKGGIPNYTDIAGRVDSDNCVIVFSHSPSAVSVILTCEARTSGQWCDLILTGHTHGGQIKLGERTLIRLSDKEKRYPAGWSKEGDVNILVSQGVGCQTVNLRYGTQAEAHLITLTR